MKSSNPTMVRRSDDDADDGGDQVGEQEGQLDTDGKLVVNIPTSVSDRKYDYRYRIEARRHRLRQSRDQRHRLGRRNLRDVLRQSDTAAVFLQSRKPKPRSRFRLATTTINRFERAFMSSCFDGTTASRTVLR